eukprot:TRINITY_DN4604_c0_g1_i2.p2 TRINITY_DN4604_c0_g1~~TRINITY_DN4604_c0_g1_i2.p2  ORF type:complete len:134 (-),score=28.92 TRINITY_DN4604_c0_g1_i2:758-1159(-)
MVVPFLLPPVGIIFRSGGGKGSPFEGGLRVPTFLSGDFLPKNMRGTTYNRPVHISDWYATFCSLGLGTLCTGRGADPTGEQIPGIVPVESVNLWPYLSFQNSASPHPILQLGTGTLLKEKDEDYSTNYLRELP